ASGHGVDPGPSDRRRAIGPQGRGEAVQAPGVHGRGAYRFTAPGVRAGNESTTPRSRSPRRWAVGAAVGNIGPVRSWRAQAPPALLLAGLGACVVAAVAGWVAPGLVALGYALLVLSVYLAGGFPPGAYTGLGPLLLAAG